MSESKKSEEKGKGTGSGSKKTQFEKNKPPEFTPLNIYSEWGTMADLKKVCTQRPDKGDSMQLKALRKLFRDDYKSYLVLYEKLLKMEVEEAKVRIEEARKEWESQSTVKRAAVAAGGQEVRVEELIAGLLQEMKS